MLGRGRSRAAEREPVDRDELVPVAAAVVEAEGLLAVTRERLALALDVPEARIPADVDAVVADAYRSLAAAELAGVKRTVLANPSPVEQMRALLIWLATPPEGSDATRLEAWVLTRRNPALRRAVQDGETAWHSLVASVIRRGARHGQFPQADADEVAAHVISVVDGINAYQLIGFHAAFDRMRILTRVLRAELGLVWGPDLADALAEGSSGTLGREGE